MKYNIKILFIALQVLTIGFCFTNLVYGQSDSVSFKVAAAQLMPVYMDREKSLKKACEAIAEAGENGAKLIVFPEAFIPGYPKWIKYSLPSRWYENSDMYLELVHNAVTVPSPTTDKLCEAAKRANINVVMGVDELNAESSNASIYNTILYISDKGELLGKHRKLIPTGAERMVWARGGAATLNAFDTSVGKLSGLICWENRMPLVRMAIYGFGTQILAAPTNDDSDNWVATMKGNAMEGGMFIISVCSPANKDWIPDKYAFKKNIPDDWSKKGNSCIIGPWGYVIAGPLIDKEDIIYGDINLKNILIIKQKFDAVGNYARPDVFKFSVVGEKDDDSY